MNRLHATLFLLLPLCGCISTPDPVAPVYEIEDHEFVVVYPFGEAAVASPWDSRLGHRLARATTRELSARTDLHVVPYREVHGLMANPPRRRTGGGDDVEVDSREITPELLRKLTGADHVLICRVVDWRLRDAKSVNLTKGRATVEARLGKRLGARSDEETERRRKQRQAYEDEDLLPPGTPRDPDGTRKVRARYPSDFLGQDGDVLLDPERVERGLIEDVARQVARLFYEHERVRTPGISSASGGQ